MRALLAAAVVAASLAAPAPAAPGDGIVLTGSTSGWVDITIPGPPGRSFPFDSVRVETRGRYGGFYAVQRSREPGYGGVDGAGGVLDFRGFRSGTAHAPLTTGYPVFSPGVVRLYLIADGPTTVHIGTDALDKTVRPRFRATARVSVAPLRPVPGGGAWTASHLLRGGDRTVGASAVFLVADAFAAADVDLCAGPPGAVCSDGNARRLPSWYDAYGSTGLWKHEWQRGQLADGPQVARQAVAHLRVPRAVYGAAFVLDLV